jgi:hypothetical protein
MNKYTTIVAKIFIIFLVSVVLCYPALLMGSFALATQISSKTKMIEILFVNIFGYSGLIYPCIVLFSISGNMYYAIRYKVITWKLLLLPLVYFFIYLMLSFITVIAYSLLFT